MKKIFCLVVVLVTLALGTSVVEANPFGAGNIVIVRVGDGSQALTNTGNTVFLDEYTTNSIWAAAGGGTPPTPVQSIQMPTNWVGRNGPLIMDGTSIPAGGLSLSSDGRFLLLAGYGPSIGQVVTQELDTTTTTGAVGQVARVIGLVDGNGHIYTSTTLIDANEDGNAIHSAVSLDGTNIWHVGEGVLTHTGGKYTTQGSMISTQVEELSSFNGRRFNISSKTLYYSANHVLGAPTNTSVAANPFGGSLPTSFVTSNFLYLTGVYGNSITSSPALGSPFDFAFFNLQGGPSNDTLYVADNTTNAPGEPVGKAGGVLKYCYIPASNAWVNFGYIYADQASGLTGVQNGTNVTLYITAGGTLTAVHWLYPYQDFSGFAGNPASNPIGPDANQNSEPVSLSSLINTRGIAVAPQGGNSGTITGPGYISVGPPFGPYFSGPQGGPFTPSNGVTYSVANLGTVSAEFSVTTVGFSPSWLTISPSSMTLASGASTTVTMMATNANALALNGGLTYTGNVIFHTGNNAGVAHYTNTATIVVSAFYVTPTTNFMSATVQPGGPYMPSNTIYTISNATPSTLSWSAYTSENWDSLSVTNATNSLTGNTGTNITVSINANANSLVQFGSYQDKIVFSNLTANTQIATSPGIVLQVGFGFFDDFSTYANGDIDGQNNWYNPTPGDNDNPYVIVDGVLVTPAGGSCAGTANDQEPAKNIASTAVTDTTQFAYLGMSMTVTSAPTTPNTWDFTLLPTVPGGNVTINEARTAVNDNGSGGYVWNTHVNGFDSFYHGTTARAYGTQYTVIIVGDIVNSNCWVFVNPPSSNTSDLFGMTYDAHDGPDVAGTTGWLGPGSVGVGSIDIDNYCANPQAGFFISKMALSTNYASVYNFLVAPSCSAPTASFTPASASGAAPLTVNFTDTSTPNSGTITTWVWTFGDGGTSGSQNPSHIYTSPGSYTASLSVTNSCGDGSASAATASVTVYDPFAWWESSNVYDLTGALTNGTASYTGDGMSNTNKFMAGFSPTNAAAYLHVISVSKAVTAGQTNVTVTYLGANGDSTYVPGIGSRTNILEYTAGTGNGSYTNNFLPTGQTNVLSGGTGLGVVTNMTDSGEPGSTNRYYRVRVLLP